MGFRCRWIATRALARDALVTRLGFRVVQEHAEEVYDTGLFAVTIGPWSIVMGDGFDFMGEIGAAHAARLDPAEVVFFETEDAAMQTALHVRADGRLRWSLTYDGDGAREPVLVGDVPPDVHAALATARAESAADPDGCDYVYDVTAATALALTGFRHDESLSSGAHLPIAELARL